MGRHQQSPVSPDAARRRYPAAVLTLLWERHLDECREVGRKDIAGGCGGSPPELARLQLQAAELAGTRTILMVPLCKDGRLLGDHAEAAQFPDLLAPPSEILRDHLGMALGDPPVCRPQPAGFHAEGPFRRSRKARLASARTGDGVRRRDDAALVAPPHSVVSGGSSKFRAAKRCVRRELANRRTPARTAPRPSTRSRILIALSVAMLFGIKAGLCHHVT